MISAVLGAVVLLAATARAADTWTDISTPLIESLKSKGQKPAWPGGCPKLPAGAASLSDIRQRENF